MKREVVGYILKRFPVLSETFVLNEILELESLGTEVHIFSLERPRDPRYHQDLSKLKAHITYVPEPTELRRLWKKRHGVRQNYPKGYWAAVRYVIAHMNPSLLIRFFQSCYIANIAASKHITHFHAHFAHRATTVAFLVSKMTGIPYSFTAHAVDIFKESQCRKALRKKLDAAKFVVTVSDYNMKYLENYTTRDKLRKVNNGIYLNKFRENKFIENKSRLDVLQNDCARPFQFLSVARFVEKKGHKVLVNACEQLRDQGLKFRCILVGQGKLIDEIREMITSKNLTDYVKILGPHSQCEVIERYHESDAFILPCVEGADGNKDGLPVSIVEALACGLPVVTTPMTGNPEVVTNGVNGLMVPFNDVEATAKAMRGLMENRELYCKLKQNTRLSVENKFDIRETVKELQRLFTGHKD